MAGMITCTFRSQRDDMRELIRAASYAERRSMNQLVDDAVIGYLKREHPHLFASPPPPSDLEDDPLGRPPPA